MRHSLLKPDGLVQTYDARTERPVEQDTHQCCHCLAGDTKILTESGVRDLARLEVGEQVQDQSGEMTVVLAKHERTVAAFHRLAMRGGGESLLASPEHPIWSMHASYSSRVKEFVAESEPAFAATESVRPGMWVAVQTISGNVEPTDFCGAKFDEELARFIGLYLAEGCIGRDRIEFGFHKKETDYIAFVKAVAKSRWGVHCSEENRRDSQTFKLVLNSSKLEQAFLVGFGRHAANKRMPFVFLKYPQMIQAALMGGLLDGDGCFEKRRHRRSLKTVSPHLAYQGAAILRRLGHHPSVTSQEAYTSAAGVSHQKSYVVAFSVTTPQRQKMVRRHFHYGDLTWVKVMRNDRITADIRVHNLTTASGTFVANGFVTHNCGRHWVYERGSGRKRGFCTRCERITCGAKACDVCIPQEARLENLEAGRPELTPPRQLVTSGWAPTPGGKILVPEPLTAE